MNQLLRYSPARTQPRIRLTLRRSSGEPRLACSQAHRRLSREIAGPVDVAADDSVAPPNGQRQPPGIQSVESSHRSAVLVIDDEMPPGHPLLRLLSREGFDAEAVLCGADGVTRAMARKFDGIVLDQCLPDISALTVLERLRFHAVRTPVVVVTGWPLKPEHEHAMRNLGVHDCLRKPVRAHELTRSLKLAMNPPERDRSREAPPRHGDGRDWIAGDADTFLDADVNQFVSILLPRLRRRLRGTFAYAASEQVDDAVTDAIIEHIRAIRSDQLPTQMGPLVESHLYRASWRNLANTLESERRRRLRDDRYGRMREWSNSDSRSSDTFNATEDTWSRVRLLAADDTDLRALRLWFDGASAGAIADALGCSEQSPQQQSAEVKRFKDRIKKRARRSR